MPKIITLAHQKGGVGKSTILLNLANSFKDNVKVGIIDTDPQGTLLQLKSKIKGIDVLSYQRDLRAFPHEVIFVDTPPYLSEYLPDIFLQSDIVLIPTKAGIADLLAIRSTIQIVKEAQQKNKSLKAAVVFNMIKYGTTLTEEVANQIKGFDVPIFKTMVADRVNFARSIALENGIYGIHDNKAEKEIDSLTKELLILINK